MKFDRRLIFSFDWKLLLLVLGITAIGILNIYSAGSSLSDAGLKNLYVKQLQWLGIGVVFMALAFSVDYRLITRHAYAIYMVSLALIVLVFVTGYATHGSQRWIVVSGWTFQPSEFVKLSVILALAKYFDDHKSEEGYMLRELIMPFLIVLVPFLFILKQPDLGTALILIALLLSLVFVAGIKLKSMIKSLSASLLMIPMAWFFLKDYQKERVLTFLEPERDPLGAGYHIIQSIIAVGSGGVLGKGFIKGTQTQLKFLPEQQTDFVFSVFAEEWGLLGSVFLMSLFLTLILWGMEIAAGAKDFSGKLISMGVTMLIFWQICINIGMVLGMLPVVGIPLPFMSYGGSSLVMLMSGVGLLLNVKMRRFVLQPK